MFHKKSPFDKANISNIEGLIKSQTFFFKPQMDRRVKNLILKMMRMNPKHRPSCREILQDKDFKDVMQENRVNLPTAKRVSKKFERSITSKP